MKTVSKKGASRAEHVRLEVGADGLVHPAVYDDGVLDQDALDDNPAAEDTRMASRIDRRVYRRIARLGMVPLDAPAMPPPGPDFMRIAGKVDGSFWRKRYKSKANKADREPGEKGWEASYAYGDALVGLYLRALREPCFGMQVEVKKGIARQATFVPGHIWKEEYDSYEEWVMEGTPPEMVSGPRPADVMVIGKMPWREETQAGRNFIGPTGAELLKALKAAHITGYKDWYITNLLKFMPPDGSTTLRKSWIKDCLPILAQELRLVRPRYILCLGSDASNALLDPKNGLGAVEHGITQFGVGAMEGRVVTFDYVADLDYLEEGDANEVIRARVMTVVHPAMVARDESMGRQLLRGIHRFKRVIEGADFTQAEEDIDHRVCHSLEDAEQVLAEAELDLADLKTGLVAWDAEWHGQHPVNPDAYLRTVQMSWKPKSAVCFVLRKQGGEVAFLDRLGKNAIPRLMKLLSRFMEGKRAVGHFLVADLEWLEHEGMNLLDPFRVPTEPNEQGEPAWLRCQNGEGGFDTAMACHAVEETSLLGLEALTLRYTNAPRYDIPLETWKTNYCKARKIKKAALEGYGDCPDEVLVPYSLYDADVTLRIAYELIDLLDRDYFGENAWEPFWESMIIQPVILEIHQTGIMVDRDRIDELTDKFVAARARIEEEVRKATNWGKAKKRRFNIRSVQHVKEYLYGEELNGKFDDQGRTVRIRRKAGVTLKVEPLLTTDKPPLRWADLSDEKRKEHQPSTAKNVLAILAQENPHVADDINRIRDYRFLDQVLKSVLRPPTMRPDDPVAFHFDDDGNRVYEAGLAASIDKDGRVRPHMYPTAETGRWKCSRPNLQNMCLDKDSEILTRCGWVKMPDLRDADEVAQYWPDSGAIDFVVPHRVIRDRYEGDLVHVTTADQIDMMLTPNHRCLLRNRKTKECFEVEAQDFRGDCHHIHGGQYVGGDVHLTDGEIAWLAAVQADGSYVKEGGVVFSFARKRKADALRNVLDRAGQPYNESVQANGTTRFYVGKDTPWDRLAKRWMPDKQFGSWILRLDRDSLDTLADEVFFWDGDWTRKECYTSSDEANVEWVQILWTLSGRRARKVSFQPKNPNARQHHVVSTTVPHRPVDYSLTTNFKKEMVPYDDVVYCVEVPSSFIVTRRNGKVAVTGNSKARDPDYERLLGKTDDGSLVYDHKLRSVMCSPSAVVAKLRGELKAARKADRRGVARQYQPWLGYGGDVVDALCKDADAFVPGQDEVFIDFDYKGAELYGMAIMAADETMIEHAKRNIIYADEGYDAEGNEVKGGKFPHPLWFDIHSNVAVMAFKLAVPDGVIEDAKLAGKFGLQAGVSYAEAFKRKVGDPLPASKAALSLIGKAHLRIVAKSVIFGVAYGRAAKAIALAVREQKVNISVEEAQQVIDALFGLYPGLRPFFDGCRQRALEDRWLCSCYGRFRRFPNASDDFKLAGEFERQAMNFPIQSAIASALDRGVAELYKLRSELEGSWGERPFKFALTIHDAVLLQARACYVEPLVDGGLIEWAMCKAHPIYPAALDGLPVEGGPYHLGLDFEVSEYWGEQVTAERCTQLGMPVDFGK